MDFVNEKLEEFNKFLDGKKVAIIGMGVSTVAHEHHLEYRGCLGCYYVGRYRDEERYCVDRLYQPDA